MIVGKTLKLYVLVKNREKTLFEGSADALTSFSASGEFDVLPDHSNFITLLKNKVVVRRFKEGDLSFEVANGILHNNNNTVEIHLGF